MKKNINLSCLILFTVVLSVMCISNVYAAGSIKITNHDYVTTNVGRGKVRKERYFETTKGIAYCITPSKKGGPRGYTLNYTGTVSKGGVLYLINKAGSSKGQAYLATQLAIWKYNSNFMPAQYSNQKVVSQANSLVAEAKKNSNFSSNPSLRLSTSTLSFTESGEYYESNEVTVISSGVGAAAITINGAPNGTVIVDSKGTSRDSFNNNEKFKIRIPKISVTGNVNVTLNAKASGQTAAYERYAGGSKQDLIVLVRNPKDVSASATGNITKTVKLVCQESNGKFYGKEGTEVTEEQYKSECESHTCEVVNGKYFGKEGTEIDQDQYNTECGSHTCEIVNGKYFGKEGLEVSSEQYSSECESHTCEIVNDKYFGKEGTEVTSDQYDSECNTHDSCSTVDGKYYDSNGNETDEATYKSECENVVPVPDTASSNNLVYTVLGIMLIGGTAYGVKKYRDNR